MAFTPKDWKDFPDTSTPINQAALEDIEIRLAAYTDSPIASTAPSVASGTTISINDGYKIQPITGTANIETITAEAPGTIITLTFSDTASEEGLIDGVGNLVLAGDFPYDTEQIIVLYSNGTQWVEVARNAVGLQAAINAAVLDISTKVDASTVASTGTGYINHGTNAGAARPTGYAGVVWVGSVEPTLAVDGDVWVDTA